MFETKSIRNSGYQPLVEHLRLRALRRPNGLAVADAKITWTWSELWQVVQRGVHEMRAAGIQTGDRVILNCEHSAHFVAAYFAVHAAGGISVVAGAHSAIKLSDVAQRTDARLMLHSEGQYWPGISICVESFSRGAPIPETYNPPDGDSLATILFTTGSTGAPKGVVHTHVSLAASARNICDSLEHNEQDRELCCLPLTHSFGLGRVHAMAYSGHFLRIAPSMKIGDMLELAHKERVTVLPLSPATVALLRKARAEKELSRLQETLRCIEMLGSAISSDVRTWVVTHVPKVMLRHHYGLTEAPRAVGAELSQEDVSVVGSIGRALRDVTIEVRDPNGDTVPVGQVGELWIRGPMLASKYWGDQELTKAHFVNGAFKTTDLGRKDSEDRIFLLGRKSELINVGGIKVSPEEVEHLIGEHPDIESVGCRGIPDPNGISGERVAAYLVASKPITVGELSAWLRERGVDPHRLPVYVKLLPSLPRSASGKILRQELI